MIRFVIALARARRAFPSQRIGQLICNAVGGNDPFYVKDRDLAAALDSYRESR